MVGAAGSVTVSVLLVDDDPQIVRALLPALRVSGLAVTVATCGADALKHVYASCWDAVIVDLGLPDMDGKAIVRYVKSRCPTPIIVISARHSSKEVEAARNAGARYFLHKPFRTSELIQRIEDSIAALKQQI